MEKDAIFPDTPVEPYPDTFLLQGQMLESRGRTGTYQYHSTRAYATHSGANGTIYFAMKRTLATYNEEHKQWRPTPNHEIAPPPPGLAAQFAALYEARTAQDLEAAFSAMGVADPLAENMNVLYRALSGKVLVILGPGAQRLWRRSEADGSANSHTQSLCTFCTTAVIGGVCEHQHLALLAKGLFSSTKAKMPAPRTRAQLPEPTSPAPMLVPGRVVPSPKPCAAGKALEVMTPHGDRRLNRLLERCSLSHFKEMFRLQGTTLEDIAAWSQDPNGPQWFKAYFPDTPAGAAFRLMRMASAHHQDSPEDKPLPATQTSGAAVPEMPVEEPPFHQSDSDQGTDGHSEGEDSNVGDGGVLLAPPSPPARWFLNKDTGVAHPTKDGVSPSCLHKRMPNSQLVDSPVGLNICTIKKRCT